jgi:hypothetical protein
MWSRRKHGLNTDRMSPGGIEMKRTISSTCRLLLPAAVLACSLSTLAAAAGPEIIVLSNRADLISGGDALVQINLPPSVNPLLESRSRPMARRSTTCSWFAQRPLPGFGDRSEQRRQPVDRDNPAGRPRSPSPITRSADFQVFRVIVALICATMVAQMHPFGNPSTPPTATATTRASG